MELLTRKLQWRGRQVKRPVPYTSDVKNTRNNMEGLTDKKIEKIFMAQMRGWQQEDSN